MSKLTDAKVIIECNYFTRPGAKEEQVKSVYYKGTKKSKKEINKYSLGIELGAKFKRLSIEASAAIKSSWASTHFFSESSEQEEYRSEEKLVKYYENTTLLIRAITFSYYLDDAFVVHKEETIVQDVKENYSLDQLKKEAKKYMEEVYDVKNSRIAEVSINLKSKKQVEAEPRKKEVYIKWETLDKGDYLPLDAVHAGNIEVYGPVYVSRFDKSVGFVNLQGKIRERKIINEFWVCGLAHKRSGEVLRTNGHIEWKKYTPGKKFPANAVYSGFNMNKFPTWVGKSLTGEPGMITRTGDEKTWLANGTWKFIWCYYLDRQFEGYVLTIS